MEGYKMKKNITKILAAAVSAALCLSLFTGCGEKETTETSQVTFGTYETAADTEKTADPSSAAVTEASAEALSLSYGEAQASIDGALPDGAAPIYAVDSFGQNFGFYIVEGNVITMFFAVIPDGKCSAGTSVSYDMLDASTVLGLFILDYTDPAAPQYSYFNSSENSENVTGGNISIDSFSVGESAGFTMKIDYNVNGEKHTFEGTGCALYSEQTDSSSQSEDDGTCLYCGGSGSCNVCHGLGYTSWGGTTIDCSACEGGVCYYCQGTGIQIYIVRGVKKQ